eukprot:749311-Alexandrium_andersonii.AAC.1
MIVGTLVGARHASVAGSSQQVLEPGSAFPRAAGAGGRTPLAHPAAFQRPGRVPVLLEHGL